MKSILTILIIFVCGCATSNQNQEEPTPVLVCGVKNPAQDLPWLKEIIVKAEEDKATMAYKGNYLGKIYLENFKDEPIFLVEMMMGSGGLARYLFRCNGQRANFTNEEILLFDQGIQMKNIVYANIP